MIDFKLENLEELEKGEKFKIKFGMPKVQIGKFKWQLTPTQAAIAAGILIPGISPVAAGILAKVAEKIKIKPERLKNIVKRITPQIEKFAKEGKVQEIENLIKSEASKEKAEGEKEKGGFPIWIIGVVIAILILFFVFKKRKR
ncbi:MAG: hypothetical protein NC926_08330 [Candidatus Omnitrophica bacterium]|nr:hypothetical protein [Candidatus Omnitrophota bacterium]